MLSLPATIALPDFGNNIHYAKNTPGHHQPPGNDKNSYRYRVEVYSLCMPENFAWQTLRAFYPAAITGLLGSMNT